MSIFKRFDHVSIGVNDINKAKEFFCDLLECEAMKDEGSDKDEEFDWVTFNLGGKKVELVAPHTPGQGGVGRYIERMGEGFHHISIAVDNLKEAADYFESKGVRMIGGNFEGTSWKHFYLHPKDTFGAMIQVFEENNYTEELAD